MGAFPELGIAGPASAMVICYAFAAFYMLWKLLSGAAIVRLHVGTIRWSPIENIMGVGGTGLVNSLTIAGTVVTVTAFVAGFGTNALAGYGLGSRLELILVPIAFGIGGALTAAVGANVGPDSSPARAVSRGLVVG
jgi:Na+-driven multidrug efflux pump